jgi:hypothetical protein
MSEALDVSDTIVAKSDQLNADDLIGGPLVGRIVKVSRTGSDQPIDVHLDTWPKPWRPSKTDRRVLVGLISSNANEWVGRSVELYRDPAVRFGGEAVGGIRVRALSGLKGEARISLAVSKGKKATTVIRPLVAVEPKPAPTFEERRADLARLVSERGMVDDVDAAHGPVETWTAETCKVIAGMLRGGS